MLSQSWYRRFAGQGAVIALRVAPAPLAGTVRGSACRGGDISPANAQDRCETAPVMHPQRCQRSDPASDTDPERPERIEGQPFHANDHGMADRKALALGVAAGQQTMAAVAGAEPERAGAVKAVPCTWSAGQCGLWRQTRRCRCRCGCPALQGSQCASACVGWAECGQQQPLTIEGDAGRLERPRRPTVAVMDPPHRPGAKGGDQVDAVQAPRVAQHQRALIQRHQAARVATAGWHVQPPRVAPWARSIWNTRHGPGPRVGAAVGRRYSRPPAQATPWGT